MSDEFSSYVLDLAIRLGNGEQVTEEEKSFAYSEARRRAYRVDLTKRKPKPTMRLGVGVIYYLRFCCRIKIGYSADLESRLQAVPCDELLATEPSRPGLEGMRHREFADARIPGTEWFRETPALVAHIRALRAGIAGRPQRERLIDTAAAMLYTGRDRHTLYRWAKEGRITKTFDRGRARWDVLELPAAVPGCPPPPPPPIRDVRIVDKRGAKGTP
ncbi:GIY-YIG nuclease family protein [Streptomyces solincola]|uniref:GIY-YIG nuclease family protein n=1 Tax=Streptomyces solincola TaxID=2100817 RepID=UPI0015E2CEC7|nr:GIY-YIG nuclease family protein [Streptomyces solincola]